MEKLLETISMLKTLTRRGQMSFQDIIDSGDLGKNRNKVHEKLEELAKKGLIKELNRESWKQGQKIWYALTPKGLRRLFEIEAKNLKESSKTIQDFVEFMLHPENIQKMKKEGSVPLPERFPVNSDPTAPAKISYMTEEEWKEFFGHKEKVFGSLRRVFFDLAKVLMKVDVGFIDAEEDLSNVTTRYRNRRAVWSVDASIKPQTHIMLKDGDEWIAVEKEKFDKATRSGKTVNEILEQERTDGRQNQGS